MSDAARIIDDRIEPRDECYHRTRCTLADRRSVPLTVVNISPHGLMARCDHDIAVGEWIKVQLPTLGEVTAAVRWALGGRLGCQFDRAVPAATYVKLLGTIQTA